MSSQALRTFNPFNLYHGSHRQNHVLAQEVVYYGESRFRHILRVISNAEANRQKWLQQWLHREVVRSNLIFQYKNPC